MNFKPRVQVEANVILEVTEQDVAEMRSRWSTDEFVEAVLSEEETNALKNSDVVRISLIKIASPPSK